MPSKHQVAVRNRWLYILAFMYDIPVNMQIFLKAPENAQIIHFMCHWQQAAYAAQHYAVCKYAALFFLFAQLIF